MHDQGDRLAPKRSQHSYLQLRALAAALRAEGARVEAGRVVDLGCGAKPYRSLFSGPYVGVDLLSTHGAPDCVAWAEHLPLRAACADVAITTQQLEHVESPEAVLAEARRVLRPMGTLLLSTHGVWPYHPDPHDYWRWTEEGLVKCITDAGFNVLRVHRQGGLVAAALGLLLYPLAAVADRKALIRPIAKLVLILSNSVGEVLDRVVTAAAPRHYASMSYLVVATPVHRLGSVP